MKLVCLWTVCFVGIALTICSSTAQYCAPKLFETLKWTLQITQSSDGAQVWEKTSRQSYDIIGQRLASHETGTRNGEEYSVFYLYYYPAGLLFTVQNDVCTTSPLTGNISDPCFSWESKAHVVDYLTKEYIGTGEDGSPIMGAIYYQDGIGSLYTFEIEGFVPLFEGKDGVIDGTPMYTLSSFLNVTFGISDPAVFTPPESCVKAWVNTWTYGGMV